MCDFLNLDNIDKVASILGNAGIFCITAYAFWLTYFSKNIKITSTGGDSSIFFGSAINCTILNKTLSPLIVEKVIGVYGNEFEIIIKDFKSNPLVIEPFHSANICGDKYTDLSDEFNTFGDAYFKLVTPGKVLFIKYRGKIKNKKDTTIVSRRTIRFNNVVVSPSVKYAMTYWYKGDKETHILYILDNGIMSDSVKGFNKLPDEVLGKPDEMVNYFKKSFDNENWNFIIDNVGR